MKQPKLYLFSKLTNIKENKRFLLDSFDFKSIRDAKKNEKFKNLKADEIYSILFTDYNNDIDESNEFMKKNYEKKIKQFKKKEVIKTLENPEYKHYLDKKALLEKMETKEGTHTGILMGEFFKCRVPDKEIIEKVFEPSILTKQINEKFKTFETLYLREPDIKKLMSILNKFKNSTQLFDEYGLPNKLGIMLYGLPGTGKTTTIHAIASYLQKDIYYVNLSTVESNEELQLVFDHIVLQVTGGGIIVFEDIDAMTNVVHDRVNNLMNDNDKLTLEYFLNLLQGSLTRDGTIFIATTNHLDKLDPAFYRTGRFDVKIDMKLCNHYQIGQIFKKFVGKQINEKVLKLIKEDIFTPADIIYHLVNYIECEDDDELIMDKFITL